MSGGSLNYLYSAEITCHLGEVERMAGLLRELGHEDAAARTQEAAEHLTSARRLQEELSEVWRAGEWAASGDYGPDDVLRSVEEWRKRTS